MLYSNCLGVNIKPYVREGNSLTKIYKYPGEPPDKLGEYYVYLNKIIGYKIFTTVG